MDFIKNLLCVSFLYINIQFNMDFIKDLLCVSFFFFFFLGLFFCFVFFGFGFILTEVYYMDVQLQYDGLI